MVVFTCAHCGDSVNKPKVEKHYTTKCRGRAPNLSCMDCFKDFFGNEHESHTKCISEAQRYGGAGFVDSVKKGEQKQNTWVELVQAALDQSLNTPAAAKRILQEVSKHSNTPRKKPRFVNFVRNVCGHRTMPQDIDAAWDVLAIQLESLKSQQAQKPQNHQNGQAKSTNGESIEKDIKTEAESVKNKKKDKKRKSETTADSTQENKHQGRENPPDTIKTNLESMEVVSKSGKELVKNRKKDKKRKFEGAADTTQEKSKNQQNGKVKPADTSAPNETSVEGDSKTEEEPVKNKKKDKKRKFETTVDSTQQPEQNPQNQDNGQEKSADTSTTKGENMDADNDKETAKSKKKGKKRKLQAVADSTQEVTHNGHATNGECTNAQALSSKKQRKEGKKKSGQEKINDRLAVNEESEDKNKRKLKKEETAIATEADGDAKNRASANETPAELTPAEFAPAEPNATAEEKFDWRAALTRLVRDAGGRLTVAKLRKRLLKECAAAGKCSEKVERKFEKRLKASTELSVEGDRVILAT